MRAADRSGQQPAASPPRIDLASHKKRAQRAWSNRAFWDGLYNDAYEFAIPYRQPASKVGKGSQRVERVYDATAIKSAFQSAGQLHQDLFPPGFFKLAPGPIANLRLDKEGKAAMAAKLEEITSVVSAFFQSGEFDMASAETCLDLLVGTGVLFPLEGDDDNPVRFICIPFDEIAVDNDAYGKVNAIFWQTRLTRRAIYDAFPDGTFPADFMGQHNSAPDEEMDLAQDFIFDPKAKRWIFCAYLTSSEVPITEEDYRTQPMAVGRYHRVPGEPYGRGPILLALPTIKTLNKAVELTLKAAAIQMLGIWGYRPGGAFNPDTVRLGPGEFWPMQATGGVLGPDVTRLDVAAGRIDVSQLVMQELRMQVQAMLGDDSLPDKGATPISASEVMARMKRISQNYLGAYGRLVNEIVPVIVRRVIEILYRRKLIDVDIEIDALLVKIDVLSPIASAVKAAAHSRIIEFIQLVVAVKGSPMAADLIVKIDDALRAIGEEQLPASLIRTPAEQKALEQQMAAAAAQIAAAQAGGGQQQPAGAAAA
ncbi:portal protein [Rhodopseudomonas palustris]|uniref:portal protein n=1 Tax=Rhodopseudomonas palustris TaxID=1076 RepID=UPI0024C0A917|nr:MULTISPECIES: portal protein [Rhodopseudomonas]WOK20614.1 portal protein [Rhodopseudomonas sp. BAL398]